MRGNLIHLVHGVFEGDWVHASRGQYGVKDRPANTCTGEREQMLFLVCLGTENDLGPSFAFLKGACYSAVATHTARKNECFRHIVNLLKVIGKFLPGNMCLIAKPDSFLAAMAGQVENIVVIFGRGFDRPAEQFGIQDDSVGRFSAEQPDNLFYYVPLPVTVVEVFGRHGLGNEYLQFVHCRQDNENTVGAQGGGALEKCALRVAVSAPL